MKVYCYAIPPIDVFVGSLTNADLLTLARGNAEDFGDLLDEHLELRMTAMAEFTRLGWEGDCTERRTFVLPFPAEGSMRLGLIYKQRNNGTCFVASPVPLPYLENGS